MDGQNTPVNIWLLPARAAPAPEYPAEVTENGMRGTVRAVTDEVGEPEPVYRFRAAGIACPAVDRGRNAG